MNYTSVARHLDDDNEEWFMCVIDGTTICVPSDPANRHYAEILKQVAAGTLTIQDAD